MAKKQGFLLLHASFLVCIALAGIIGAGLMVFQQLCLNNPNNTFLTGHTCMSDSHSRALLAAAFTVMTAIISQSVSKTAVAYRTAKLSTGIPEGVYVALGTNALGSKYIIGAMKCGRAWAVPVLLILLAAHSQNFVQTLANLGIQVSQVYIQNTGTANVFDAVSFYNVTNFTAGSVDLELDNAIVTLSKIQQYRSSAVSSLSNDATSVITNTVRDGYVVGVNHTVNDLSNAFRHEEVVATIVTQCDVSNYEGPAEDLFTNTSIAFNQSFGPDLAGLYLYDVVYEVVSPTELKIGSVFTQPQCLTAGQCEPFLLSAPVQGQVISCDSNVTLAVSNLIYTVPTDFVQLTGSPSNETTVPIDIFAELLVGYAASPEGVANVLQLEIYNLGIIDVINNFPTALFNLDDANYLHAKLCAGASLGLELLWENYGRTLGNAGNATAVASQGNAFGLYDRSLPLHNLVILTYISTVSMALIVGTLVGAAWIICMVGMTFAQLADVNIKAPSDISLLYNVDEEIVSRKRYTIGASNDPDQQCRMSFDPAALLFCREADSYSAPTGGKLVTGKRVAISYGTKAAPPPGDLPNTRYDYW